MPRPQKAQDWSRSESDAGHEDWADLRDELHALLDQVEDQYARNRPRRAAPAEVARRVDDLRSQVDREPGETVDRRRRALRSVQQAVQRFSDKDETGAEAVNPRELLHSAVEQIRARQQSLADHGEDRAREREKGFSELSDAVAGLATRLERIETQMRPNEASQGQYDQLARAVEGIAARLEGFEAEMRAQRTSPDDLAAIAKQMGQLTGVVETLAGVVGDNTQANRIEGHIADLARLVSEGSHVDLGPLHESIAGHFDDLVRIVADQPPPQLDLGPVTEALSAQMDELADLVAKGPEIDLSALTDRLDALADTVNGLGRDQAERAASEAERTQTLADAADTQLENLRAVEESVRNIYDRIDGLETTYALTPEDVKSLTGEMAAFTEAMRTNATSPTGLLARVDAIGARLDRLEDTSDGAGVDALRSDIDALRQAITETSAQRFDTIESHISAISERLNAEADEDITVAQLESQVRQLVARMDQTGEQITGLARLYKDKDAVEAPDYDQIADLVAERAASAFNETRGPNEPALSAEELGRIEERVARVVENARPDENADAFSSMREGMSRVDERLGRLESAVGALARPESTPAGSASAETSSTPAEITRAVSSAPQPDTRAPAEPVARRKGGRSDTMPRNPADDAPLREEDLAAGAAQRRASSPDERAFRADGDTDAPAPEAAEIADDAAATKTPHAARKLAETVHEPVFASRPSFDPETVQRPAPPQSTLLSETDDTPGATSRTSAPKKADKVAGKPTSEPGEADPKTVDPRSSRSAFIAAARKAAQENDPKSRSQASLISQALARLTPAHENTSAAGDAAEGSSARVDEIVEPETPKAEKTRLGGLSLPRLGQRKADRTVREEPALEKPAAPDASAEAPADIEEAEGESFLVRHRRPILLAATLVAASVLTMNLIGQRLAESQPADPAATTKTDAGSDTKTTGALDKPVRNVGGTPVKPRIKVGQIDGMTTGSITETAPRMSGIDRNALPTDPAPLQSVDPFPGKTSAAASGGATVQKAAIDATVASAPTPPAETTTASSIPMPPAAIGPLSLRQAAVEGDPRAQFEIGAIYTEGRVVQRDYVKASVWYERAAAQGFAPAQYRLGSFYEHGNGVDKDMTQARLWYERAANAGNRMAMHNLAALYAGGALGKQNFSEAAKWFEKAANLGVIDSQFNLGMLYARGLGVPQDMDKSYKWFALAAMDGDKDAEKARDEVARSLDAASVAKEKAAVAAFTPDRIDVKANFAPIGTWTKDFDPGKPITTTKVVKHVQEALNHIGYDAGTPDGVMGPKTGEAIKAFEKATGMSQTGQVNPRLLAVLGSQPV